MTRPSQVPAMVAAHQEMLLHPSYIEYCARFFVKHLDREMKDEDLSPQDIAESTVAWCRDESKMLGISQMFHITESMTDVARIAAEKLPSGIQWSPDSLPAYKGVLVFEHPLHLADVWGRIIGIAAITWRWDFASNHLITAMYTDTTDMVDEYNRILRAQGTLKDYPGRWSLMHYAGAVRTLPQWLYGDEEDMQQYRAEHTDDAARDEEIFGIERPTLPPHITQFANLHTIMYSIFALMDQSITDVSVLKDHRTPRLKKQTRKLRKLPADVTVIQLRRREQHGHTDEHTGRWLTYRSVTRGHWRNQPCGTGRSEVKRIWISPYIRGSSDLPFYQPKRVSTLQR